MVRPPSRRAPSAARRATAAGWPGSAAPETTGQVQPGLAGVVERAAEARNAGILQATGLGEPAEPGIVAQRGRREYPGGGAGALGRKQPGTYGLRDVQRRLHQPQLRTRIHPAHAARLAGLGETGGAVGQCRDPLGQPHEIRADLAHGIEALPGAVEGSDERGQRVLPGARRNALWHVPGPAQLAAWRQLAEHQPQIPGGTLHAASQALPIRQAARLLQAGGQHVAGAIEQLASRQMNAQKLHPDLVDLVGLIENRHPHRWQQLRHARLAHREIGKEQVVVDHHHIRRHGLAPGQIDMACPRLRATRAQAVLAGGRHQRDHR